MAYDVRSSDWSSDVCSSDLFPYARVFTNDGHRPGCNDVPPGLPESVRPARPGILHPAEPGVDGLDAHRTGGPRARLPETRRVFRRACRRRGRVDRHRWFFARSEEHTSELQSLMRISYAV